MNADPPACNTLPCTLVAHGAPLTPCSSQMCSSWATRRFRKIVDSMSTFNSWEISQEMLDFRLPLKSFRCFSFPTWPLLAALRGCRLQKRWLVQQSFHLAPFSFMRFKVLALEVNFVRFCMLDPCLRFSVIRKLPSKIQKDHQ